MIARRMPRDDALDLSGPWSIRPGNGRDDDAPATADDDADADATRVDDAHRVGMLMCARHIASVQGGRAA